MTKEEAISIISGYEAYGCGYCLQGGDEVEEALSLAIDALKQEPVRHGKYIGTEFDGYADGCPVYYEWKCSECGCVFEEEEPTYNYCPNCGAKMDEVEE